MLGIVQQVFKKIKPFLGSLICFYFPVQKKKFTGLSNTYTDFCFHLIDNLFFFILS